MLVHVAGDVMIARCIKRKNILDMLKTCLHKRKGSEMPKSGMIMKDNNKKKEIRIAIKFEEISEYESIIARLSEALECEFPLEFSSFSMIDGDGAKSAVQPAVSLSEQPPQADICERQENAGGTLKVLQSAYLYHCLDDDEIGSEELGDMLLDEICNIMGNDAYQKWVVDEAKRIRGEG